ncbi:hypothetical protein GCM10009798_32460 [Nocardioides panacihumi]|uniref:Glycosyltransferase n=1 Tax=Nocardioides panacihumi TaxID=400774 RepID=A0ABN2RHQ3_9ACTN
MTSTTDRDTGVGDATVPALTRSAVFSGALWTAASSLLMRVANIGVTAVVAHVLTRADFGVFAVAAAVYLVVSSLAELGLGAAVTRSTEDPRAIAPTVTTLAVVFGGALAVLMYATAGPLADLLGSPGAAGPLRILSLCLVLNGLLAVPCAQLTWEFRQGRMFFANAAAFIPSNIALVLLAMHGDGATAFAWSRVIGQVVTGVVVVTGLSRFYWPGMAPRLVKGLVFFGLPLAFANLVNWTLLNADYLVIAHASSEVLVGTYMLAFTVASWPTVVMGSVLNGIVVPALARVGDETRARKAALVTSLRIVSLCALPVGALVLALARPVVLTLYGDKWAESIPVLQVLAVYGTVFAYCLLLANVMVALGLTWRLLAIQVGWIVVLTPLMLRLLDVSGLVGVAWAHVLVVTVVALPLYVLSVPRSLRWTVRDLRAAVTPALLASAAAGVTAWGVAAATNAWLHADPVALLAGGTAGVVVYLLAVGRSIVRELPDPVERRLVSMVHRLVLSLQRKAVLLPGPVRRALRALVPGALQGRRTGPRDWSSPLIPGSGGVGLDRPEPTPQPVVGLVGAPAQPLSCLVVTGSLDVGGMDGFVDFLARGLRSRGVRTEVLVAADRPDQVVGRFAEGLRADGFDVLVSDPESAAQNLDGGSWDCLSVHGVPDWIVEAAHDRGIPVVETLHGMHTFYDRERLAARAQMLTAVVAVSELVGRQYLEWVPAFEERRLLVVPNGVPSRWRPTEVRDDARAALGLTGEFVFTCLGRYCLQKNQYGLVVAFDAVADAVPDAHLVLAGRVDDEAYFAQVADRREQSPHRDRIHVRQHSTAPGALLAASDAFVLDSFFEGWSLASTEALTAGLPVVLAEVGGAVEQVDWDVAPGVVVPNPLSDPLGVTWDRIAAARFRDQPNAAALSEAMIGMATQRATWAARREPIAHEAEARFSPEVCLDRHLEILVRSSQPVGVVR